MDTLVDPYALHTFGGDALLLSLQQSGSASAAGPIVANSGDYREPVGLRLPVDEGHQILA